MSRRVNDLERAAFYRAAMVGLRALDARENTPRRFGPDADARWAHFAGELGAGDRLDFLLRDAAGTWGAAFSPVECFGFVGLADDEPFGPFWTGIDDGEAERFFEPASRAPTLDEAGDELGASKPDLTIPAFTAATKLVVAGGSAIVSLAKQFATNRALSWTDQVVVVADKPAWRQLAGLAAVLLAARGRTALVRPGEGANGALRGAGFAHLDLAVVSSDAEPEAAEFARKLGGLS